MVQVRDNRFCEFSTDSRVPARKAGSEYQHDRAHVGVRDRIADARCMRSDEIDLKFPQLVSRKSKVRETAESRVDSVQRLSNCRALEHPRSCGLHSFAAARVEFNSCAAARHRADVAGAERTPIENDRRGGVWHDWRILARCALKRLRIHHAR